MNEQNRINEIRNGLFQYIGSFIQEFDDFSTDEIKHLAVAQLSEVWLECCSGKDGDYDFYSAKPLLRATSILLKARAEKIYKAVDAVEDPSILVKKADMYMNISSALEDIIKSIPEREEKK